MSHFKSHQVIVFLLLLTIVVSTAVLGQAVSGAGRDLKDSSRMATVEEMAKRVDSLQFIVVYNAELLRRDLDSKMVLIYVMLGIIILASMLMYALLKQTQRQRKDLEEKLFQQLAASVAELDAKIKRVETEIAPPKQAPRKKKT